MWVIRCKRSGPKNGDKTAAGGGGACRCGHTTSVVPQLFPFPNESVYLRRARPVAARIPHSTVAAADELAGRAPIFLQGRGRPPILSKTSLKKASRSLHPEKRRVRSSTSIAATSSTAEQPVTSEVMSFPHADRAGTSRAASNLSWRRWEETACEQVFALRCGRFLCSDRRRHPIHDRRQGFEEFRDRPRILFVQETGLRPPGHRG